MEAKIAMMKAKINAKIKVAYDAFNGEWSIAHSERIARIDGMIDMLCVLTDTEYYYDENGLHEK